MATFSEIRSGKTMRFLLWATLILTLPSFVLLYGWSSLSQVSHYGDNPYGEVVVSLPGRSVRQAPVTSSQLEGARSQAQNQIFMRLFQVMGRNVQSLDFAKWERVLGNNIADRFALDLVAEDFALEQLADSWDLVVPHAELARRLSELTSGASQQQINESLRRQGLTVSAFQSQVAHGMLVTEARGLLMQTAPASLYELWQEYLLGKEEIEVSWVTIPLQPIIATIEPTDEEVRQYFRDNRKDFTLPDRLKLRYISVSTSQLMGELESTVTAEELQARYDEKKETFFKMPREVEGRHLAIHFANEGQEGRTRDEALQLANQARIGLELGEAFAAVADRLTDDPLNTERESQLGKGGLLDRSITERSTDFGDAYRQAVLALQSGELSQPIVSTYQREGVEQNAVFLFKAEELISESYRSLESVEASLRRELASDKAKTRLAELSKEWQKAAADAITMDDIADAVGKPAVVTPWIERNLANAFVPGLGGIEPIRPMIERVWEEGGLSPVMPIGQDRLIVFEVDTFEESHVPQALEDLDTSATVRLTLQSKLALEQALAKGKDLMEANAAALAPQAAEKAATDTNEAPVEESAAERFKRLASERSLTAVNATFTRTNPPGELQLVSGFARRSLGQPVGLPRIEEAKRGDNVMNIVVWQTDKRNEPARADFAKELPALDRAYRLNKAQALLQERINDMRLEGGLKVVPGPAIK